MHKFVGYPHLNLSDKFAKMKLISMLKIQNKADCKRAKVMSFSAKSIYNWYRSALRNPKYRWWLILGTLAYLISPIDFAPDFLPIIGQLDDLTVLTLLVSEVTQLLSERIQSRRHQNLNQPQTDQEPTVDVEATSAK